MRYGPARVTPQPIPVRSTVLARWAAALGALYGVTWVLTGLLDRLLLSRIDPRPVVELGPSLGFSAAFLLFFVPVLYLIPCALAHRWLRPPIATVILYCGTAYFFGCGLELVMDRAFIAALGRPCYLYFIWPIHDGHTSGSGLVMWPLYGFFVCMLHQAIHASPRLAFLDGNGARAALLAVDAMLLELAANVFSLVFFGSWLFRYHAPDLHHFTTVEAFPIYLLGGYPGVVLLDRLEHHPRRGVIGAALWVAIIVIAFGWEALRR